MPGVPPTTGLYRDVDNKSRVFRLLLVAALVQFIAKIQRPQNSNYTSEIHTAALGVNWFGWAILWLFLTVAAEYDATTDLAVSFALLMLIVVLVRYGERSFNVLYNLGRMVSFNMPAQTTPPAIDPIPGNNAPPAQP